MPWLEAIDTARLALFWCFTIVDVNFFFFGHCGSPLQFNVHSVHSFTKFFDID